MQRQQASLKDIESRQFGGSVRSGLRAFEDKTCHSCEARSACLIKSLYESTGHPSLLLKHQRSYEPGEHLFHAGAEADSVYIINNGSLKSYVIMEDGDEQVLNFMLSGDAVGLDALGGGIHVSSAVALEPSTVCRLSVGTLSSHPPGVNLLSIISRQMVRDHNMKLLLARKDADSRVASFLLTIAAHYEALGQTSDVFHLTMSRQDIANYLGMAIETVSRCLRRFKDAGILDVTRRTVCIDDFARLQKAAGTQVSG